MKPLAADKLLKIVCVQAKTCQHLVEDQVRNSFHARVPESCREQFHQGIESGLAAIDKLRTINKYGRMVFEEGWSSTQEFAYGDNDLDLKGDDLKRWNKIIKKKTEQQQDSHPPRPNNFFQPRPMDNQYRNNRVPKRKVQDGLCFGCGSDSHQIKDCKNPNKGFYKKK